MECISERNAGLQKWSGRREGESGKLKLPWRKTVADPQSSWDQARRLWPEGAEPVCLGNVEPSSGARFRVCMWWRDGRSLGNQD